MKLVNYLFLSACLFLISSLGTLLHAQCTADQGEVVVVLQPDENFLLDDTHWEIYDGDGDLLISSNVDTSFCLPLAECYTFTILDDFGDGLAGGQTGFYSFSFAGDLIASGVNFGFSQTAFFGESCLPGSNCFFPIEVEVDGVYTVQDGETWYRFVPEEQALYTISTCGFSNTCNTAVWVYDRCLGLSGTESQEETILFNDDACDGDQAEVTGVLYPGVTYYLRLGDENDDCRDQTFQWTLTSSGPIIGCTDPLSCNFDPLATVDDGSCLYGPDPDCPPGPDLIVKPGVLSGSIFATNVGQSTCYVNEGCLQGYGQRQVVRFTTHIQNVGTEDYVIGSPDPNSGQFEFDECHGHWHQEGYAEYRMYDENGLALPVGFKNGFCVLDLECSGGGTATYGCSYMGISAGCGDIYSSGLACQWIDVTELPEGIYTLVIVVNWDRDADLFGREEVSYENNWDQVCFELTRNANGDHAISVIGDCATYEDCEGVVQGDAQPDCYGNCGGDAKYGDLNVNGIYEVGDVLMYLNGILDSTLPVFSCTDLTGNDLIDLEDPVWLMDCILVENQEDGHEAHAHSCQLPTIGITNPNQTAEFSLLEHNETEQYFVVAIENPSVEVIATHFRIDGLVISSVELVSGVHDANVYFRADGQVMVFSYIFDAILRAGSPHPYLRVYYSEITDEDVCLSEVYTTINKELERINDNISIENCLTDLLPCSETEPNDTDGDGVCDDVDVCPGGDDYQDADEDGIPDLCDACPDSATNDSDGDGVCDDLDVCIGMDDSTFCEEFVLRLTFDRFSEETRWEIRSSNNEIVVSQGFYPASFENTTIEESVCLNSGEYTFIIYDSYGDGMCCGFGIGDYELIRNSTGQSIIAGGEFDHSESTAFSASSTDFPDADNDGVCDLNDQCPGNDDLADADVDGTPDGCDACPNSATGDSDGDSVCDDLDICPGSDDLADADADGTPDGCDDCPNAATGDSDGDGVCDDLDICPGSNDLADADADGTPDGCDACPNSATGDSDGDGVCDDLDICPGSDDLADADADGTPDGCDACPNAATGDSDGDGVCDDLDICPGSDDLADADADGTPDGCDACPNSATGDSDGDSVCDDLDICPGSDDLADADADGTPDGCDACPNAATGDSDGDGVCDDLDICPGSDDLADADADGTPDGCDACPNSATGDSDGNSVCDDLDICPDSDDLADADADGTPDGCDACPNAATGDSDGDGVCDDIDICPGSDDLADADADGTPDGCDDCPNSATGDSDGDSVCDDLDICPDSDDLADADADGTPDGCDACPNAATGDSDGDGVCDDIDICPGSDDLADADEDGTPDGCDDCPNSATGDSDGDGVCDDLDICPGSDDLADADADGMPDGCDACPNSATGDSDGDSVCDDLDICPDSDDLADADADGTPDGCDACPNAATGDSDGDGVCDDIDICPGSDDLADADEDGTPDGCDDCPNSATGDSDGDGVCDDLDICPGSDDLADADADGMPDGCDACPNSATGDSDGDSVCDDLDICPGSDDLADADADGTPDGCDACPNAATGDSDGDSVCDDLDICPDGDDLVDVDMDGIPDDCDDIINAVDEAEPLSKIIEFYPNPTTADLNLAFSEAMTGTIVIYDVYGQKLQHEKIDQQKEYLLDVTNLPSGTYLLVLETNVYTVYSKRFVKIKF